MKSVLVVVGDATAGSAVDAAIAVARRFGSHLVGLHAVTTEYAVVFGGEMGFSISSEVDRTLEREAQERRDQARRLFREKMAAANVPLVPAAAPGTGPTAEWREEDGRQNAVTGSLGRVFDLIVVEQPTKLASLAEATLEDALFESGRLVLMVPAGAPPVFGERICIAWNGSTETARTVALSMPFLLRAREVKVVSVESGFVPGPAGAELAANLARHGINVSSKHVQTKNPPGETMLAEAQAVGADLMVKGAYTQSRLRQMIFGGATRHIINEAKIPVLMAH
ncbi:MAG: universal stress protein [Rhodospirillales bacterium]|nr:universal stress protein [Rhodospirillales bacterium]